MVSDEKKKFDPNLHPSLRSLPQEEFDKLVPATKEKIQAALDKGRKARDAFLATQWPKRFR